MTGNMTEKPINYDLLLKRAGLWLIALAVFMLIDYLSNVLLPFFIAWVFAYLLYPIVAFVDHRLHTPRAISIVLTLIVAIAVLTGLGFLIVPSMVEQFEKLGALVTDYIHKTANIDSIPDALEEWFDQNHHEIEQFFKSKDFTTGLQSIMPGLFSFLGQTYSLIVSVIASFITLLYMFFILLDYEYLSDNWIRIFPEKLRPFWQEVMGDAKEALNNYLRGQGLVALIMGVLFCIGFTIIDFPMAIGLGIMIGIMDMVPYLHTFALIPTVLLALLKAADTGQNFWIILLGALIVFIVVQLICDMIVTPKVMGSAMGLNPAILLLSLSVWGALMGFIGLIIALPLTSLLIAYYQRYVTKEDEKKPISEKSAE